MFVTEDVDDACRIALDLIAASGGTLPPVRVGLACGEMASVFGDLYGPDVNLARAARRRGRALDRRGVRAGAGRPAERAVPVRGLPPLTLKGFAGPTTAYGWIAA